jgi:predicted Zn-dependent peptidase
VFQKSVLNNGLRVITEELPHFHSVALGVWLNVGSRDESEGENGLTHFLEHMAFKATSRRSARDIAREIDQVGGAINAFTTKESTCFHARVLTEHLPRVADLISDLVLHPLYQPQDLERERQVILEEIGAQEDTPEDLVQIQFARHFWGDHPFGRPILGEPASVVRLGRDDLLNYRQATYLPAQTVVAAAGRLDHQEVVDLISHHLGDFENGAAARPRRAAMAHPGTHAAPRDLEQVHLCLGTRGPAASDLKRYPATLLQLLLGGNVSSRLFQVIREQLGLAYAIYSFVSFFSDTGVLGIAAGVSPRNLEAVLSAVCREVKKLKEETVPDSELQAAREYLKGSILLAAEDMEHRMMRLAKNELHFGHYIPLEEIIAGLMKVSPGEILEMARELFQAENWALALLGPVEGGRPWLDF